MFVAPAQNYSYEIIFSTTSTNVGICEFNSDSSGNGGSWDRSLNVTSSGQLEFYYFSGGFRYLTSPLTYNDGNPHHVVITHQSNNPKMYVDGVEVASGIGNTAQYFALILIGYSKNNGNNFVGTIDEFVYYINRVLTPQEIADRYALLTS
ncbi:LamG domain-containing protein [Crocosphaera sp. Alani8]